MEREKWGIHGREIHGGGEVRGFMEEKRQGDSWWGGGGGDSWVEEV